MKKWITEIKNNTKMDVANSLSDLRKLFTLSKLKSKKHKAKAEIVASENILKNGRIKDL